jgi:CO/xanthine dehydrogenase FAD-binding subunit
VRGNPLRVTVSRPATPAQAIAAYAARPDSLPVAGGTDLMVSWNAGEWHDREVLDLSALAQWRRIDAAVGELRIGALATHTSLRHHEGVRRHAPLLASACATIGGIQIQNRGTLGGNIANASPAGDTFPPLAVYDAVVHIASAHGARQVPFAALFAGVKKTVLEAGELIEAVTIPIPAAPPDRVMFRKVGTRAAQAISKVVAAGALWFTADGTVADVRFALGSVAPTVKRAAAVEKFLKNRWLTRNVVREACLKLEADIKPIDDIRSTAEYRMNVAKALLSSFLGQEPR